MPGLAYFTICSQNYLGYALTLGRSLKYADPDATFFIGLADEWDSSLPRDQIEFPVIEARDIGLPTFNDMIVRYSIMEFNTAIKARMFGHLFDEHDFDHLVYLDPDIKVVSELTELKALLAEHPSAVLTPHSEAPLDDGKDPDDVRILRTGAYNLGFAAFSNRPDSRAFLSWWEKRMEVDCRVALAEGLFVDQKLMDLAPCYMDDVRILRHPGYNLAYWNLMHRPITRSNNEWQAAGKPLRFCHFSGVIPGKASVFSKHQNRFRPKDIGELHDLFVSYVNEIEVNGRAWISARYAYDEISGLKLDSFLRKLYARAYPEAMSSARVDASGLERMANAPIGDAAGAQLTRYALEVWSARDDLKAAFDITTAEGRAGFAGWITTSGRVEHGINKQFLTAIKLNTVDAPRIDSGPSTQRTSSAKYAPALYRAALPLRPLYRSFPAPVKSVLRRLAFGHQTNQQHSILEARPVGETGICLYGYFDTESGVGEGARRAFWAMQAAGIDVEARALQSNGDFLNDVKFDEAEPGGPTRSSVRLYHVNADQTAAGRNWLDKKPTKARQIAYWAWELEKFPQAWVNAADDLDEIWVPSQFVKASVEAATDKPVVRIPHPIEVPDRPDAKVFAKTRQHWKIPAKAFVVLNTFDFNSYIARKNPHGLLNAFELARRGRDSLTLVIKVHGSGQSGRVRREVLDRAATIPGVIVIDKVLRREELDALQWISDAFVSLHRSEGFGLNIAEAMAKGKPIIATDYSGSTDFVDGSVGIPVPYTLIGLDRDDYPFAEGQVWADPDIEAARDAIGRLYDDRDFGVRLGTAGRDRVISQLSYGRVGSLIKERLKEIGAIE
ncbi:glycosyltransferase [Maricaulis sp.]|uniref:glycosyltransferase family 4 protein n=1 Tax=Maricaulis sp. TaxID=1486257 RepID=UPI00261FB245|nr:glycosyltransferase [Maricaulis sp.]MDF1769371.1 glycosyltransferase [Maricaulis sp.]